MSEKKTYVTTERAGFVVAGHRIPAVYGKDGAPPVPQVGFELHLTDDEAAYELAQLTIELKKAGKKAPAEAA